MLKHYNLLNQIGNHESLKINKQSFMRYLNEVLCIIQESPHRIFINYKGQKSKFSAESLANLMTFIK